MSKVRKKLKYLEPQLKSLNRATAINWKKRTEKTYKKEKNPVCRSTKGQQWRKSQRKEGVYLFAVLVLRFPISLCSQLLTDGGQRQITGTVIPAALLLNPRHTGRKRGHSCSEHTSGAMKAPPPSSLGVFTHRAPHGHAIFRGVVEVVGFKRVPEGEDDGRLVSPLEVHLQVCVMEADPELLNI